MCLNEMEKVVTVSIELKVNERDIDSFDGDKKYSFKLSEDTEKQLMTLFSKIKKQKTFHNQNSRDMETFAQDNLTDDLSDFLNENSICAIAEHTMKIIVKTSSGKKIIFNTEDNWFYG